MTETMDVVVVGGGIGGASLAYALVKAGLGVTVLEASTEFADRVRGESMQAWGVKEARDLGVEQVLLDAGAHITPVWKQYLEGSGYIGDIPMSMMIPDIPGSLNLRHPDACQALLDAASGAGATVVRGVHDVTLGDGSSPTVVYNTNRQVTELRTTLVVGADGRASTVRKQTGITLERQEPRNYIAGLLVDGLDGVPDDHDVAASEGEVFFLVFHQGGGRARVYLCTGSSGQHRFSGRTAAEAFLAACAVSCYPWSQQVMSATPAGPCATYPGDDTWTDAPYADGVVLIGDAAGYNDPIIGQGLSIAMRDARIVRDLVLDDVRRTNRFAPYGEERVGRMERLRFIADLLAAFHAEDADNRPARRAMFAEKVAATDSEVVPLLLAAFAGPETIPQSDLDPEILERVRQA
jgi:2-polyprenyl-6-methoxyphenol hydroxylase-like FAD-dependent oxidoreductase